MSQTIEIATYLLSKEMGKYAAEHSRALQRILSATTQLKELNETFNSLGPEIIAELESIETPEQILKRIHQSLSPPDTK